MQDITKKELKQIYYINREIEMWQRELDKLRCKSLVGSPSFSGMPRGGIAHGVAEYATDVADIEVVIAGLLAKAQIQRKRIIEYIDGLEDSLTKQIIFYRHVSCMSWAEVANVIGGGNSEENVRQIHTRFFKK